MLFFSEINLKVDFSPQLRGFFYDCALKVGAKSCIGRLTGNTQACLRGVLYQLKGTLSAGDAHQASLLDREAVA